MRIRLTKVLGITFLVLALAITQIPSSDVRAETSGSASTGTSASDFQRSGDKLIKYSGTLERITIPSDVKWIADGAFEGNEAVKEVIIPSGVLEVGNQAFSNCGNLEKVEIADSVVSIGDGAFGRDEKLSSVRIGTGLESLGSGVFAGCSSLKEVDFRKNQNNSSGNFVCSNGAIYDKGMTVLYQLLPGAPINHYVMPNSVEEIMPYSFWRADQITDITLNSNLSRIAGYAFSNARGLEKIVVPFSVREIDVKAFQDCFALKEASLPATLKSIHSSAFDGCYQLKIQADDGTVAGDFAVSFNEDDIARSEYEARARAAQDSIEMEVVEEEHDNDTPAASSTEGKNTKKVAQFGVSATLIYDGPTASQKAEDESINGKSKLLGGSTFVILDNSSMEVKNGSEIEEEKRKQDTQKTSMGNTEKKEGQSALSSLEQDVKSGKLPKYEVAGDIITKAAYYGRSELEEYTIEPGITLISDFAFARSGIETVEIPDSVTEIGYAAFYHADQLENVGIPASVQSIEPYAFQYTPWLTDFMENSSSDYLIVGDGILLAYCGNDSTIAIPQGVKTIGPYVFANHLGITSVDIPEGVEIIGEGAFQGCKNLSHCYGLTSLRRIEDRAFQGCPLVDFHIPATVETIGLGAFDFTDTSLDREAVLYLDGEDLPDFSYEKTASKLSNLSYRVCPIVGAAAFLQDGKDVLQEMNQIASNTNKRILPGTGEISIYNISTQIPDNSSHKATLSGEGQRYSLKIKDSEAGERLLKEKYQEIFGKEIPNTAVFFDCSLQDDTVTVPITDLGKQTLSLSLKLNSVYNGSRVLTIDQDGQLESIPCTVDTNLGTVTFETNHFSPYCIYSANENGMVLGEAKISGGEAFFASLNGTPDTTPDTGEAIPIQYVFALGLAFAGLALLLWKKAN